MKDINVGDEFWAYVIPWNRMEAPIVKKIVIKDIHAVMVTADINGLSIDVPKDELYSSEEEAVKALQKILDEEDK